MKKKVVVILAIMMLSTFSYASPISQQWVKLYGEAEDDCVNCIQQTMDGGYIGTGLTRSFPPGSMNLWVLKFDANGNVSWQKTYHLFTFLNNGYTIQQTTDGGYIVGGYTSSLSLDGGWILKLDNNGEIVWQKFFDEIQQFYAIQQIVDGGYVALGIRFAIKPNHNSNIIVLKLDGSGNIIWQKSYDISEIDEPHAIKQTTDGGYVITGYCYGSGYDIFVLKINYLGDVLWGKTYGGPSDEDAYSIQITSDGGYIIAGGFPDALVFKLDSSGNILWQKTYDGGSHDLIFSIQQTADGGYTTLGYTRSGDDDIWIMKLDAYGNIIWQRTYGGDSGDWGFYFDKTNDGGYVIAGNTHSFGIKGLMILKLDSNGEIPGCDIIGTSNVQAIDGSLISPNVSFNVEAPNIIAIDTDTIPQDSSVEISEVCYYENPTDVDGDGIENSPGGLMAISQYGGSFLAELDNCSESPNGPYLGTCTKGNVGSTCIANGACGTNGFCSMNQEDTYPPLGNDIGDACDCEGNFDCDNDCDGTDAATFKADFGRSTFNDPCNNDSQCHGDFDCDQDCDGTDAAGFKVDFGRSGFNNPCPACAAGDWCIYP